MLRFLLDTYEPTPENHREAALADEGKKDFLDTIVPQAVKEGASAIVIESRRERQKAPATGWGSSQTAFPYSLAFIIGGRKVPMAPAWGTSALTLYLRQLTGAKLTTKKGPESFCASVQSLGHPVRLSLEAQHTLQAESWTIRIAEHGLTGPIDVPARLRAPLCRYCNEELESDTARQCLNCGMNWHDEDIPVLSPMKELIGDVRMVVEFINADIRRTQPEKAEQIIRDMAEFRKHLPVEELLWHYLSLFLHDFRAGESIVERLSEVPWNHQDRRVRDIWAMITDPRNEALLLVRYQKRADFNAEAKKEVEAAWDQLQERRRTSGR